jgi:hypothetical protein
MALLDTPRPSVHPTLPRPRGPITEHLVGVLRTAPADVAPGWGSLVLAGTATADPLTDDDLQLALHVVYELSYRGFTGVDDRWEWDRDVLDLRAGLEARFEADLRRRVDERRLIADAGSVAEVLNRFAGPSLSDHMARAGTVEQFREFVVHRSAYQLKEADPHSWAIPRFSGARKSALIEIQADEYGHGRAGQAHAEVFARLLDALDLDSTYGALVDRIPAVTLATGNLISMFGTQQRLRAALLGHLAAFEMTSVRPMTRYAAASLRLGLPDDVGRFFTMHVDADEHHGDLAESVLVGGDVEADGLERAEMCFGVAALLVVEDAFSRHLLRAWAAGESSLR